MSVSFGVFFSFKFLLIKGEKSLFDSFVCFRKRNSGEKDKNVVAPRVMSRKLGTGQRKNKLHAKREVGMCRRK